MIERRSVRVIIPDAGDWSWFPLLSTMLRLSLLLAAVFGAATFAGCASSSPQIERMQLIHTGNFTNLMAYRSGTNLDLRIPLRGRDAYVYASWQEPSTNTSSYQHRFVRLAIEKDPGVSRRSVVNRRHRIPIRDTGQWQQLVQSVFSDLIPSQPGHGVIVLFTEQELVLFQSPDGKPQVAKLENKPPDISVDRIYNDADFSRETIQRLEAGATSLDPTQGQYLFVTGEDPPFVFIDLRQRLMVFLTYPADAETEGVPIWFVARAFHSVLFRSLVVTAIKNPFTLVNRGLWHLGNSGAAAIESVPDTGSEPVPPLSDAPGMDLGKWERELDDLVSAKRYKGHIDFLIDGENFFPAFTQSIEASQHTIDILVFIFDNDDYAVKIADLLRKRSEKVRVRVLMDDMGSLFASQVEPASPMYNFKRPSDIQSYLESGSEVQVRAAANPWLTVDHRKCVIVDSREAYIGGMNIGREYRFDWHDMMVRLTGPIVGRLEKDYRLAWAHAGPLGDFAYAWIWMFGSSHPRKTEIPDGIDIRPLRTATGKMEIYRAQLQAIERAQRTIYIENAYFDDGLILRGLIRARRRGVDVRVIFPAENDSGIMQTCNLVVANELVQNGIRVYTYPKMTHVKAALYDGWACLGSANFDKMSLRINQELDVAFSDPEAVGRLKEQLFNTDFARSVEFKSPVALNWLDSFVKTFADQL